MLDVVYRDARGRLTELAGALTGEQLRTRRTRSGLLPRQRCSTRARCSAPSTTR